jgi:6-pyruvoyltetrahydropterin/6-carboxytetrahydropterin synthase
MYTVSTEIRFRAKHALKMAGGAAEPMHDHNWRARAVVQTEHLDADGMVIDFYQIKRLLREAVRPLGESESINAVGEFQRAGINPSTEQIARYIYERLAGELPEGLVLTEMVVWETADCRGGYGR